MVLAGSPNTQDIRPGDVVYIEPNEEHWPGATYDLFTAHVAIQEADEGVRSLLGSTT